MAEATGDIYVAVWSRDGIGRLREFGSQRGSRGVIRGGQSISYNRCNELGRSIDATHAVHLGEGEVSGSVGG